MTDTDTAHQTSTGGIWAAHRTRRRLRAAGWALISVGVLWACDSLTSPGDGAEIVISFDSDTTLVVGTVVLPSYSVTVDGVPADRARLDVVSSDPAVFEVTPVGDSLFVNGRGVATLTITLIGSTLSDSPPELAKTLRAVADSVVVTPTALNIRSLNDTTTLRVTALDSHGNVIPGVRADWHSTVDSVASVDENGLLTALRNGIAEIHAIVDDDTAVTTVSIAQRLARYDIEPSPVVLNAIGATQPLSVTARDSGGSVIPGVLAPSPEWRTGNAVVATVSSDGTVTAVTNGETSVTASAEGVVNAVPIEVRQVATRVEIVGPSDIELDAVEDTVRLYASAFDALDEEVLNSSPQWISRDLQIVQVDPTTGVAIALGEGATVIAARVDAATDSVALTIRNVPTSIEIGLDTLTFSSLKDTTQVAATVRNKFNKPLTGIPIAWSTADPSIAEALSDGRVTAVSIGTTSLTAAADGASDQVVVLVQNLPENVDIIPVEATLASVGDSVVPAATIRNARGDTLSRTAVDWTSEDLQVATVTASGLVIARGRGEVYVRAINPLNAAKRDSLLIRVTNAPASIDLTRQLDTLTAPTQTLLYGATVKNARGADITDEEIIRWYTLNASVATVSSLGLVTAEGVGETGVIAEAGIGDGLRADTATLQVLNVAVSLEVSPTSETISSVGDSLQMTATAVNVEGGLVTNVAFEWSSTDTGVATVTSGGLVEAKSVGTTTITVRLSDLSANAVITVINAPDYIDIIPDSAVLASIGDSVIPAVVLLNARGDTLERSAAAWESDDDHIALALASGTITAESKGTTQVRAENSHNPNKFDIITITVTNAPTSIVMSRTLDTLPSLDRTLQYDAEVFNARGNRVLPSDWPVTWHSSNTAIAEVTASGLATAKGIGDAYIVASSGGVADTALLVVLNSPADVAVSPSPVTLASVGATQQLTATVRNELGNIIDDAEVLWSTSNPSVASVDSTGLVEAFGSGSASVNVTSGSVTTSVPVTVTNHPSSIDITDTDLTLASLLDTVRVQATILNEENQVLDPDAAIWTSSNQSVATVSDLGTVTAVGKGTARIRATSPASSSITDFVDVTVTNAVASVTLNTTSATLTAVGEVLSLSATVRNAAGNVINDASVSWVLTDSSVVELTSTGNTTAQVTAVARGDLQVTATAEAISTSASITVTNDAVSISVTPSSVEIFDLGTTTQLSAVALNNLGAALPDSDITWSSLDTDIATVNQSGLVTATTDSSEAGQTVEIVALAVGGVSDNSLVTVYDAPQTVDITPDVDTLASIGDQVSPPATILNQAGTTLPRTAVVWTSSATQIATVTDEGLVTAQGVGTAEIRATSPFNATKTDLVRITVTNAPDSIEVSPQSAVISALGNTAEFTAVVKNAAGNPLPGENVVWSSHDDATATVSTTGVVTAVDTGSVWIVAEVASDATVRDSAEVTITNSADQVSITPDPVLLTSLLDTVTVRVTALNENGIPIDTPTVAWTRSGSGVFGANLSSTADSLLVTATDEGQATLTATIDGSSATIDVTVSNDVDTIKFLVDTLVLPSIGQQETAPVVFLNALGDTIANLQKADWSSANQTIASVQPNGLITAVAEGVTEIRAESKKSSAVFDTLFVEVRNEASTVEIDSELDTLLQAGQRIRYGAVARNAGGVVIPSPTVSWQAVTPGVVNLVPSNDSTWVIAGIGAGQTYVVATVDAAADTVLVVVEPGTVWHVNRDSTGTFEHGTLKYPFKTLQGAVDSLAAIDAANRNVVVHKSFTSSYAPISIPYELRLMGDTAGPGCSGSGCAPNDLPEILRTSAGVPGISVGSEGVEIEYLRIRHNTSGPAIYADVADLEIAHVHVNPNRTGSAIGSGFWIRQATAPVIRQSSLKWVKGYGVRLDTVRSAEIDTVTVEDLGYLDATFRGSGIQADGSSIATHGLVIDRAYYGFVLTGSDTLVSAGDAITGGTGGVKISSDDNAVTLTSGTITSVDSAVTLLSGSGNTLTVGGGTLISSSLEGINVGGSSTQLVVDGAEMTDVAGACLTVVGTNVTALANAMAVTDCGASAPGVVLVNGTGDSLEVTNSSFTGIDGRIVDFINGRALVLDGDTLIGTGTGTSVESVVDVPGSAGAQTVSITNSVFTDFAGQTALDLASTATVQITDNRIARNAVGIELGSVSGFHVADNDIYDHETAGARGLPTTNDANVIANWWGDGRGPRNYSSGASALDSAATGDSVTFAASHTINRALVLADPIEPSPATEAAIVLLRGANQPAATDSLQFAFTVRIVDADGRPVSGVDVRFESSDIDDDFDPGAGGRQESIDQTTNSSGIAEAHLDMGAGDSGDRTVTVSVLDSNGDPVSFPEPIVFLATRS